MVETGRKLKLVIFAVAGVVCVGRRWQSCHTYYFIDKIRKDRVMLHNFVCWDRRSGVDIWDSCMSLHCAFPAEIPAFQYKLSR